MRFYVATLSILLKNDWEKWAILLEKLVDPEMTRVNIYIYTYGFHDLLKFHQ